MAKERHFTQSGIESAIEALAVEEVPIDAAFVAKYKSDLEKVTECHHLAGVASEDVLIARLPDDTPDALLNNPLRIMVWGWPGKYGACLTLTCFLEGTEVRARIVVPQWQDSVLERLLTSPVVLIFSRGTRPVRSYRIDFAKNYISAENLEAHINGIRGHIPTESDNSKAHYWETLDRQSVYREHFTARDLLSLGWYDAFDRQTHMTNAWLASMRERNLLQQATSAPPLLAELLTEVNKPHADAEHILRYMQKRFCGTGDRFVEFVRELIFDAPKMRTEEAEVPDLIGHLVSYYMMAPEPTDCGRKFIWFDFRSNSFVEKELVPKNFPNNCNPRDYWARSPWDVMNYARGMIVSECDFPVDMKTLRDRRDTLPVATDAAKVSASADALFEEAVANKIGTIPPGAVVDLSFGPFTHMEITECEPNVIFMCRNEASEFLQVIVEPRKNHCSFHLWSSPEVDIDHEAAEKIDAGVKMLFAAIVRDFWVVENRESVFACRTSAGSPRPGVREHEGPQVVYVPRVRYTRHANVEKCTESLDQSERRAHLVRGFIRRATSPSSGQLILAQRYGIDVPTGYTFVRPHERGKVARDVIYRSRSALRCMYTSQEVTTTSGPSLWFDFERDVRRAMMQLGFTIQHVATSRRGDQGVDVYATKGSDLDAINWVIQCKCWRPSRKVFPATVRELIGTLQSYPRGTHGMIVTTSSFSSGAISTAQEGGIRLMDGEEFSRLALLEPRPLQAN